METVKENLKAAKALIDTPEKWVKGTFHRDGCRCILGALIGANCFNAPETQALIEALPTTKVGIATFNDHPDTTHADIMALFDRAIAAEEAKEAAK